jgi:tetratricopeptide (TPR) repeat protein
VPTPLPNVPAPAVAGLDDLLDNLESAWQAWRPGEPLPRWEHFLPAAGQPCTAEFVLLLIQTDIELRVQAGLPALLAEPYFDHPRLQEVDLRLDEARQVELIGWEYQQRWERGQRAARADYVERFPPLAVALAELRPRWSCPRCYQKGLALEEDAEAGACPRCQAVVPLAELFGPPRQPGGLDLRRYDLLRPLGRGGMGEVYLSRDPGLDRPLAVKVLRAELGGDRELERRFEAEARITGSLQHPGIVPVYNLGRLPDGRLYFTMKVVKGQTFAQILRGRSAPAERREEQLGVFLQVCQAVAYAHSRGVIHRDLKPENVMVGAFGEVQVMDWGLAKLLPGNPPPLSQEGPAGLGELAASTWREGPPTRGPLGTPEYMAPEQANGEWEAADERLDVFGLGGILCTLLTGGPPFRGGSPAELMRKAQRGDLAEAFARLDGCGAEAALVRLAKDCLCPEVGGRPANAGVLARRVAEYQAAVQQRLRRAELERAEAQARAQAEGHQRQAAQARARAERRARRLLLGLAAAVLLAVTAGGAVYRQVQQQRADAQNRSDNAGKALERARTLLDEGLRENDLARLKEGHSEVGRALGFASGGEATEAVRQQATALQREIEDRLARWDKNSQLRRALLDVAAPRETRTHVRGEKGILPTALTEPTKDEQYAAAFRRRWRFDVDRTAEAEVVATVGQEPPPVVQDVIAALDAWALERRREKPGEAKWRRLLRLADRLDRSDLRRRLRALLSAKALPPVGGVVGLLAARPCWPALWDVGPGKRWRALAQLRQQVRPPKEPVLSVLLLARALEGAGDVAGAEGLLRDGATARPKEVVLLDALGRLLERHGRLGEAIECYRAARAQNPLLGVALSQALARAGRPQEGERVLRDLLRRQPDIPDRHFFLGVALKDKKDMEGAIASFQKAIALQPTFAHAHNGLGAVLCDAKRDYDGAIACFKKAIALDRKYAHAHHNLGNARKAKGDLHGAIQCYKKALALDPNYATAHYNLGVALDARGKDDEAIACYRRAVAADPRLAPAHNNLGVALADKGDVAGAIACYQKAIAIDPKYANAHANLGIVLHGKKDVGGAIACYRRAIAADPEHANAHGALGLALLDQGRFAQACAATRRCLNLLPAGHPSRRGVSQLVRQCQGLLALDNRLTAVLQGKAEPKDTAERLSLANLAQQPYKRQYAAAAGLYSAAFTAKDVRPDLLARHRYNAARAAALAAAGKGPGAPKLDDMDRARWRKQALDWLSAELAVRGKQLRSFWPATSRQARQSLQDWQRDPDLAGVRDKAALAKLPEEEGKKWQKLWADVATLLKKAQAK